ncbi:ribonuclease H-like domain-containing protein [Desulfobacter postgatei]|uniref:YprB ribonuclease H-like domain-containing protein n=1 Tax=Desulfobacter postgatei 2ac9 TaxID=879212 RepID=I5B5J5_9BACT|nr:ribonuclease H-like domain-containing protein [Desulfobacter postgatei]EIM64758.1 hypothetical protein DespoDRAFT_02941 [Desulfobacter postgatei 2ac9]
MLTASFSCFSGLSSSSEQKLWELGCLSWDQFEYLPNKTFSREKMKDVRLQIDQANIALKAGMPDYFLNRFANPDKIRVLEKFQKETAIIDIETTGLRQEAQVTSIAVLKHGKIFLYVKNINLSNFLESLEDINLIITYNGTRFDLPFIRKCFKIDLTIPHLDLLSVLKQLGYTGGQKQCEARLGLDRNLSPGLDGRDAIRLWESWQRHQIQSDLNQLLLYNAEDVFMLEKLAVHSYNLAMKKFPISLRLKSSIPGKMLTKENIVNFAL